MSAPCYAFDLVTFDVGGTLLTLRADMARAYAEVLAEAGCAVAEERLAEALAAERAPAAARRRQSVGADHRVSIEAGNARRRAFVVNVLRGAGLPEAELERCADAVQAALDSPRMYTVYDDALPTLRELWSRGLKLGVVSNTWPSMPRILLALGFGDYLGYWVISEFVGVEKPDPAIFERALEIGGSPAARALHVGDDYETDFLGARGAGMQAILLDRGDRHVPVPERDPDGRRVPIIHRLDELLAGIG